MRRIAVWLAVPLTAVLALAILRATDAYAAPGADQPVTAAGRGGDIADIPFAPNQRRLAPSPCTVVITGSVGPDALACSPTPVTVTLAVSCPVRLPLNVVLVIGRHLAMQDHLNEVKTAARAIVGRLDFSIGTKVGVVSLSTQERVEQDLTDSKATALSAIGRIQLDNISPFNQYYDWLGQAERMLLAARSDGDTALEVIIVMSTGCPPTFDGYCQRQVGSANRAQGSGITVSGVCNPNAQPFGFPFMGEHCRWIRQMSSSAHYHDLQQASRVSGDLDDLIDQGGKMTIDELVLTELPGADIRVVAGSAAPVPDVVDGEWNFEWQDLSPGDRVTVTYAVTTEAAGTVPLRREGAGARLRDSLNRGTELEPLALRDVAFGECVVPTSTPSATAVPVASATPTVTPTPVITATPPSRPGTVFLPVALAHACRPGALHADIVLVLDASTSMDERDGEDTKLAAAKQAAGAFVAAIDAEDDQVAVVAFNSRAWIASPLGTGPAGLRTAIDEIATAPGTRIDLAFERAGDVLGSAARRGANQPVVILLTDGRPDEGTADATRAAAGVLKGAGVTVYVVGLGVDVDEALLNAVASGPGRYRSARSADDLVAIYEELVGDLPCPGGRAWP